MGRSTRLIPGFDYRTGKPDERTLDGWREELAYVVRKGGRIDYAEGETLAFFKPDKGGLQFEIYERIKIKETVRD